MIGIFDSGLGGLTVARHIISAYPQEDVYYLADTAGAPYGEKSSQEIADISVRNVQFLVSQGASRVVIACNTATAAGLALVSAVFPHVSVVGVIEPTAQAAVAISRNNRIGVLATSLTVKTQAYVQSLRDNSRDVLQITQVAAPLFVPLIDKGVTRGKRLYNLAQQYCENLLIAQVDTVILGCTHYPLISSLLMDILGEEVTLVNGSLTTVHALQEIHADELLSSSHKQDRLSGDSAKYYFTCSGVSPGFDMMCRRYLARYIPHWPGSIVFPHYANVS